MLKEILIFLLAVLIVTLIFLPIVSMKEREIEELVEMIREKDLKIYNLRQKVENLSMELDNLELKYSISQQRNSELVLQLENLKKQKGLVNPTYLELFRFVAEDDTNGLEWSEKFDCTEFSNRFISNFAKRGYFSCVLSLDLRDESGKLGGHDLVVVNTTDKGMFAIEPQDDSIIPYDELEVGINYCSLVGWDCKWKIEKISSCFGLK